MSDDWTHMTDEERRDLVGRAVRVIWVSGDELGLLKRNCCVEEHVRVSHDGGGGVLFERRVAKKDKRELPAPEQGS